MFRYMSDEGQSSNADVGERWSRRLVYGEIIAPTAGKGEMR